MALIGLLLTAVSALKFGFGALITTFWATFQITGDRFGMEISRFGKIFLPVFSANTEKAGIPPTNIHMLSDYSLYSVQILVISQSIINFQVAYETKLLHGPSSLRRNFW